MLHENVGASSGGTPGSTAEWRPYKFNFTAYGRSEDSCLPDVTGLPERPAIVTPRPRRIASAPQRRLLARLLHFHLPDRSPALRLQRLLPRSRSAGLQIRSPGSVHTAG